MLNRSERRWEPDWTRSLKQALRAGVEAMHDPEIADCCAHGRDAHAGRKLARIRNGDGQIGQGGSFGVPTNRSEKGGGKDSSKKHTDG